MPAKHDPHRNRHAARQDPDKIREAAKRLDDALQAGDMETVVDCFAPDCEIQLLGITLAGKTAVRRWLDWNFSHLQSLRFEPVRILVDRDVFVEEFVAVAVLPDGQTVRSSQAEVLIYENYLVKKLSLYFDRLDFADAVATNFASRAAVNWLKKRSLHGLAD